MCSNEDLTSKVFWDFGTYNTFTIFSMKKLAMCKVYTDVGGIK